jgi:hypothetical protein
MTIFYNTLIEFGMLFRLIKMYLNEGKCKFRTGRFLSGTFPLQNDLKEGKVLSPLLLNVVLE